MAWAPQQSGPARMGSRRTVSKLAAALGSINGSQVPATALGSHDDELPLGRVHGHKGAVLKGVGIGRLCSVSPGAACCIGVR